MADFDPFANQGGPVAWDPEHSADAKKQAEELSRRLAADKDESGNGPSSYSEDSEDAGNTEDDSAERDNPAYDDTAEVDDV